MWILYIHLDSRKYGIITEDWLPLPILLLACSHTVLNVFFMHLHCFYEESTVCFAECCLHFVVSLWAVPWMVNLQAILQAVVGPSASHKEEHRVITYIELKRNHNKSIHCLRFPCCFWWSFMFFHALPIHVELHSCFLSCSSILPVSNHPTITSFIVELLAFFGGGAAHKHICIRCIPLLYTWVCLSISSALSQHSD